MLLNLSQIGQIALPVADVDRAEAFYGEVVGLRKLFRCGTTTISGRRSSATRTATRWR
jgi:catechol 2,3-dioxygenase-like lactoylglutathione lyase family enzyme